MVRRGNVDVLSDQLCVVQGLKGNEKGGNSPPDYTLHPDYTFKRSDKKVSF
jgi:hypothetical protein